MMWGKITGFMLAMSFALHASAEQPFPGAIQEAASIPCTPTCLLCHTDIPGTRDNLKQPFGLTVLRNGIQPGHPESMQTVIANLRDRKVDTDSDGKLDVDELAVGSNPNLTDPKAELCGPEYGCGAHLAPAPPPERAPIMCWLVGTLAIAALVVARRWRWTDRPARRPG
jgi:hypothetical protein